jgi:ABC-type transport system involved in multi-copper enzyme maturation permease subunit
MWRMKMNNFKKIVIYTLGDQMRHKSVFILLGMSILFIMMIRGCYDGQYTVNEKVLDSAAIAQYVSKIVFHLITVGTILMASLLSMKLFSRDQEDGNTVLFLSRSVFRWHYVLGRVVGTWVLCVGFMFLLHLTIFTTVWLKSGTAIPGFLMASLISSLNLLFVIACVCCFSLLMPDFISVLVTFGILFVGFVSDGGYQFFTSDLMRTVAPGQSLEPTLWRVWYPKVFMVQAYADTVIGSAEFHPMGPLHPVVNLSLFILLLMAFMVRVFNQKEI